MVGKSSVVARGDGGSTALPRRTGTTLFCVDECTEWDIRDQFETMNGMPVYYGGDLYDSDDSDWDDPYEIASADMWRTIILTFDRVRMARMFERMSRLVWLMCARHRYVTHGMSWTWWMSIH